MQEREQLVRLRLSLRVDLFGQARGVEHLHRVSSGQLKLAMHRVDRAPCILREHDLAQVAGAVAQRCRRGRVDEHHRRAERAEAEIVLVLLRGEIRNRTVAQPPEPFVDLLQPSDGRVTLLLPALGLELVPDVRARRQHGVQHRHKLFERPGRAGVELLRRALVGLRPRLEKIVLSREHERRNLAPQAQPRLADRLELIVTGDQLAAVHQSMPPTPENVGSLIAPE